MGRRLFEERNYDVTGKVLPLSDYRPFLDAVDGFTIQQGHYDNLIKKAEQALEKELPQLIASEYMMFRRTGNRTVYETKMFARRMDLLQLAVGEFIEKKGRFMDRIVNLLWLILEETTWIIPASNPDKIKGIEDPLPYAYKDDPDFIGLFAASAGATLGWVYYLLKDELDKVTPIISERMEYELERRIIRPFMDPKNEGRCWWMAMDGRTACNWNPWIISNVLTLCSLVEKDTAVREKLVARAMIMLDNFSASYHDDGGCDEGPGYWDAAGAGYFDCLQLIYDMTGGYVNMFDDPLVKNMGEYEIKVNITGNRFLNFADCKSKITPDSSVIMRWGKLCNSEMMVTYAKKSLNGKLPYCGVNWCHSYRYMHNIIDPKSEACEFIAPTKFWFDGIVIAGARETSSTDKGKYFAIKGGNNGVSHNHNDLGNFIVFADGQPIFIDAGSGVYTRKTFSNERYTIWAMRSEYHNCATVNGYDQPDGSQYKTTDHVYDDKEGSLTLQLKEAYPAEAGIESYTRKAELKDGNVIITDNISLKDEGTVAFNYLCNVKPENVTSTSFEVHGKTVSFPEGYTYSVEPLDNTQPEVERIPLNWDCDVLYRVRLTANDKLKNIKFELKI